MEFEWDPAKEARNLEKHGISFVAGAQALASGSTFEVPIRPRQRTTLGSGRHASGDEERHRRGLHDAQGTSPDHLGTEGTEE
jgi:hypothetical protein